MMEKLTEKKCVACEGGVKPLSREEFSKYLDQVPEWEILEDKKMRRNFEFKDFKEAIKFIDNVAEIANSENHHPDLRLHDYKFVEVLLWTHAINGLFENDFIMAAKIDALIG